MAMPEMQEVKDLALKYDKPALARLVQMGQVSPTLAVMAGMMRDRVVQSEMKPPQQTVAEEVMQPMGQRMGLAAAQQMPQQRRPGLDQVPVPPQMFDEQRMAGGGIVAFQAGGTPPPSSFAGMFTGLGPDLEVLAAARKAYMGDFPMESPEERERRRREENAMRLMEIGLGIAGGESPYFASNLKGALPGIRGAAEDVKARRQEELARLAAERAEKGKVFEGVLGMREKEAERIYRAAEAEKERQAKAEQSELDRALQTSLKNLDVSNRLAITRMDIASKEKIANMPPDVIRGAQAIQKPGEDIGAAVERFSDLTTKATNNNTAKVNAYTAMLKSANEQWNEMTGISGSLRDLADAANGDKKALATAKKQFGVSTTEEAIKLLNSKRDALIAKREKDLPFTKAELQQALANEKQPGGARSFGTTPSATGVRKPSQAAIDALMKDPTPDMKKQFEDYYGISADAYLGR